MFTMKLKTNRYQISTRFQEQLWRHIADQVDIQVYNQAWDQITHKLFDQVCDQVRDRVKNTKRT